MGIRKNEKNVTAAEWTALIAAMAQIHTVGQAAPRYADFVKVHVRAMDASDHQGMSWHVHSMGTMDGFNFLSWHRYFLLRMEHRLQAINPAITLPYWDATNDRAIPARLADPQLLADWSVNRGVWNAPLLATPVEENAVLGAPTFRLFQKTLEGHIHGGVHNAVGGDMAGSASPSDPLFFLHHANMDRLWSVWQTAHPGLVPSNVADTLQPPPLFNTTVSAVQSIATLGYSYI